MMPSIADLCVGSPACAEPASARVVIQLLDDGEDDLPLAAVVQRPKLYTQYGNRPTAANGLRELMQAAPKDVFYTRHALAAQLKRDPRIVSMALYRLESMGLVRRAPPVASGALGRPSSRWQWIGQ